MKKHSKSMKRFLVLIMVAVLLLEKSATMVYATTTEEQPTATEEVAVPEENEEKVTDSSSGEDASNVEAEPSVEEAEVNTAELLQPRTLTPGNLPATWEADLLVKIPDPIFRQAIKEACERTMTGDYSAYTTEEVLAAFDNEGENLFVSGAVSNLDGLQLLTGLELIDFDTTALDDISNLYQYRDLQTARYTIEGAPIHIWPQWSGSGPNALGITPALLIKFRTDFYNSAKAVYVYNSKVKTVQLVTGIKSGNELVSNQATEFAAPDGVTMPDATRWDKSNDRYTIHLPDEIEENLGLKATFNGMLRYRNGEGGLQWQSVTYSFFLDTEYYSTLKFKPNSTVLSNLTFTKYNEDRSKVVSGAGYEVYTDAACTMKAQQAVVSDEGTTISWEDVPEQITDDKGQITVENLRAGTYHLKETKAPAGYELDASTVTDVTVTAAPVTPEIIGGEGNELEVTADNAEFKTPDKWSSDANKKKIKQQMIPTTNVTKKAADYNADLFIKNGSSNKVSVSGKTADTLGMVKLVEPTYVIKDDISGGQVASEDTLEKAVTRVNNMIADSQLSSRYTIEEVGAVYCDKESAKNNKGDATDKLLPVNVKIGATKTFEGGVLSADDFTFKLEDGAGYSDEKKNAANGSIVFDTLKFENPGDYSYTLKEIKPDSSDPQIEYDTTERHITINVKDVLERDGTGAILHQGLKATIFVDGNEVLPAFYASNTTNADGSAVANIPATDVTDFVNAKGPKPVPGYEIEKIRIDTAPLKEGTDKYGFKAGETVTYEVIVRNTGETDLTMDVRDMFTNSGYFKDITYVSANVGGANAAINALPTKDKAAIKVAIGETCTVTITAVVTEKAVEKLANQAADDKASSEDGHRNTATVSNVTSTWTKTSGEVVTETVLDYPTLLADKSDTADTPVQGNPAPPTPVVKTGDNAMLALYLSLALISMSFIGYRFFGRKKREQ